jgi:DnaJ-domain-containing protein 1
VVLHTREKAAGGPYRVWSCGCGMDCGALENRAGDWLLYPLEGLEEPGILDRLVPRHSREAQRAAVEWWQRHRAAVERFRRATRPRRERRTPPPPPSGREKRAGERGSTRRKPPPRPASPPPPADPYEGQSPYELLGIEPGPDAPTIKSAYRRALKLCHPDRVANLDPDLQDVAHRKSKALRRAYEELLGETDA